ncbi:hypothetical protein L1887_17735 [Cichorium endivia]|nr:hypothetical protein L1887_17735 [Cichorium endivia]
MTRRSGRGGAPIIERTDDQAGNDGFAIPNSVAQENATTSRGRGRGGRPARGRGRGQRADTAPIPSIQGSSHPGGTRGRGRGRGIATIPRNELVEEITRVLQATLPTLLAEVQGDVNRGAEKYGDGGDEEHGSHATNTPSLQNVNNNNDRKGCSYKTFQTCKPPTYYGDKNPITTMRWVKEMEAVFKTSKCINEDKVTYATNMLKAEALYWWDMETEVRGSDAVEKMSWEEFKKIFREKFCPRNYMRQLEEEFLRLEQGTLTVAEYTTRFTERARFAEHYVATEERRVERFIWGLKAEI